MNSRGGLFWFWACRVLSDEPLDVVPLASSARFTDDLGLSMTSLRGPGVRWTRRTCVRAVVNQGSHEPKICLVPTVSNPISSHKSASYRSYASNWDQGLCLLTATQKRVIRYNRNVSLLTRGELSCCEGHYSLPRWSEPRSSA